MDIMLESMKLPVDNLLGMLLYAILFMGGAALIVGLALRFIPNSFSYFVKNIIIGISVFLSLYIWWITIV